MKGKILGFKPELGEGVIAGDDNSRYNFHTSDWHSEGTAATGTLVDFIVVDERATEIYAEGVKARSGAKSDRVLVALLAFFLGYLGVHKFYMGYKTQGVILLACSILGWPLLFLPFLVACSVSTIEAIIYISKSDEEFEETYIIGNRPWF
jgi:TM2 domain-containing membrane protein YozV